MNDIYKEQLDSLGKFTSDQWGKPFNGKLGWFLQEAVSPIAFVYFFYTSLPFFGASNKVA